MSKNNDWALRLTERILCIPLLSSFKTTLRIPFPRAFDSHLSELLSKIRARARVVIDKGMIVNGHFAFLTFQTISHHLSYRLLSLAIDGWTSRRVE